MWSFGAGVAVHASLNGVAAKDSISRFRVLESYALRIELSSSTTQPKILGSSF